MSHSYMPYFNLIRCDLTSTYELDLKLHCYLDALSEIKLQYFTGNEVDRLEPKCDTVNVAGGAANGIGHLFVAWSWFYSSTGK